MTKRRVFGCLVLSLLLVASLSYAAEEAPQVQYGKDVGSIVKPFKLKAAEGDKVLASDDLKRPSVFVMVSSVCTACRAELSEINENIDKFKEKADLYAVVIDMDPAPAVPRIKRYAPELTLLVDSEYELGGRTGLNSAPSTVVIGPGGKILHKNIGYGTGQWRDIFKSLP